jgi:uncharacterized YccA/Bax inhibitor family protein
MATESSNPALTRNPYFNGKAVTKAPDMTSAQLKAMYDQPAATDTDTNRMSYEDVAVKTLSTFVILLIGAAIGWVIPALMIPAAIIGFVLALVNTFKKEPSPALILLYAGVQGLFVGGISGVLESMPNLNGIVLQAVMGTLVVFGVTLALFANGKIRASKKATKIFLIAIIGYAVFSLLNMVLMLTGVTDGAFGLRSAMIPGTQIPFGVVIGLFAIVLAAYSLVLDFDFVQRGVKSGAPRKYGWSAAFGLTVTLVWLYIEMLRLIAIFRSN